MPFSKLGLNAPIVKALTEQGYQEPTPIQQQAIPKILAGKDVIAAAQTGTGKTASFVLPLLQKFSQYQAVRAKRVRALILTPTRELAIQVEANIALYSKHLELKTLAMYGGVDSEPQKQRLIEGVDILVATPGRLLDMYGQRALHFDELEVLVLDEADRMLDMGFIDDISKIIDRLPAKRQSLLFSATLSREVRSLAQTLSQQAVEIAISPRSATPDIKQWLITVDKDQKSALLSHLIKEQQWDQALIFIQTKHGAAKLVSQLEKRGIKAEAIHSGRSQAIRSKLLEDFKSGALKLLVATGVAARGIDINDLSRVVNYDLPHENDDYIHRIGRTGRAGAAGEAISFVSKDDFKNLCSIERRLGKLIERKEIDGFAPRKEVPISVLNFKPKHKRQPQGASASSTKERKPAKRKPVIKDTAKKADKNRGNSKRTSPWGEQ